MDYSIDYLAIAKEKEKPTRYHHTLGVVNEAVLLAKKYKVNEDKARIAASLHDITKNDPIDKQVADIVKYLGKDALGDYPIGAYHSLSGAIYAKEVLEIDDDEIINAIKYHTLGKPDMTTLEKIIFIADFIEPSRESEESEVAKKLAYVSLDKSLVYILRYTITLHEQVGNSVPKIAYDALKFYEEKEYEYNK